MNEEIFQDFKLAGMIVAFVIGIILIITFIFAKADIIFKDIHRENVKHSHAYIESTINQIHTIISGIEKIDVQLEYLKDTPGNNTKLRQRLSNQRLAEINRLQLLVERLPENEIPNSVKKYIK